MGYMGYLETYKSKVITAEKAAALIQSNMIVEYTPWVLAPVKFDIALGKRAGELGLEHVNIRGGAAFRKPDVFTNDPEAKTFNYGVWYFSGLDRKLAATPRSVPYYVCNYHEVPHYGKREERHARLSPGACLFDKVIVVVMVNHAKTTKFSMEERVQMLSLSTRRLCNVEVDVYEGLIAEYARLHYMGKACF